MICLSFEKANEGFETIVSNRKMLNFPITMISLLTTAL